MKRIWAAAAAVLAGAALVGCSASTPPDPAELQSWISAQQQPQSGIGQMAALASRTSDVTKQQDDEPSGIRIDLAEPTRITSIEFSCTGAEAMDAGVHIMTGSSHIATGAQQVRCADGPVSIDASTELPVTWISADGFNSDGHGAWSVVVR